MNSYRDWVDAGLPLFLYNFLTFLLNLNWHRSLYNYFLAR